MEIQFSYGQFGVKKIHYFNTWCLLGYTESKIQKVSPRHGKIVYHGDAQFYT